MCHVEAIHNQYQKEENTSSAFKTMIAILILTSKRTYEIGRNG